MCVTPEGLNAKGSGAAELEVLNPPMLMTTTRRDEDVGVGASRREGLAGAKQVFFS